MLLTIYSVIFIAIVMIIASNIVKNHGKDCVSIDFLGFELTSAELIVIAFAWPLAIVYFVLWLLWVAFRSILKLFEKDSVHN